MVFNIYSLSNPITNEIFYIGITIAHLKVRKAGHLAEVKGGWGNTRKAQIIKACNFNVSIKLIEAFEGTKKDAHKREKDIIREYLSLGHPLCNDPKTIKTAKGIKFEGESITVRPGKKYAGLVKKIQIAAKKEEKSVNEYLLNYLSKKINFTLNEQNAGSPLRGETSSESSTEKG